MKGVKSKESNGYGGMQRSKSQNFLIGQNNNSQTKFWDNNNNQKTNKKSFYDTKTSLNPLKQESSIKADQFINSNIRASKSQMNLRRNSRYVSSEAQRQNNVKNYVLK